MITDTSDLDLRRRRTWTLVLASLGVFMTALDTLVVTLGMASVVLLIINMLIVSTMLFLTAPLGIAVLAATAASVAAGTAIIFKMVNIEV